MENVPTWIRDLTARPEVQAGLIVLASLIVAKIGDFVVTRGLRVLAGKTRTDLDDKLIALLHKPIYVSAVLLGLYFAVGLLALPPPFPWVLIGSLKTLALLIWSRTGLKLVSTLLEGLGRLADRVTWIEQRTLPLFDNLAKILIVGGSVYALLLIWDMDVKPWLASAGIMGIALGFAAKDTLANFFGGLSVIIDAPYKVGDFINLDSGARGQVTRIGLRSTRILTRDDVEITVPNGLIGNSTIVNETGGPWKKSRVFITAGVAYGSDIDRVREILMAAALSVEHVVRDPEPRIRFVEMADSALVFRVMCWIDEPVLRGRCIDGLNTAVYKALNEANISIPFPQRDVHMFRADANP